MGGGGGGGMHCTLVQVPQWKEGGGGYALHSGPGTTVEGGGDACIGWRVSLCGEGV